ncbi:MAG: acyl-[acyl-carrier-protein] thioesterase [Bacteroidota bacterium]
MENSLKDKLIYSSRFIVTSADTDMYARIKTSALVNFLIQSAIQSADNLGFGYSNIREQQLFWVMSRLTLKIKRPLKWYENVDVETWPKDIEKILYIRDYLLRDTKGLIVAEATSGWLAVDLVSKRPKIIEGLEADFFNHLSDRHALEQLPDKLSAINGDLVAEINTAYYDIDLNRHVTATRYIDWMMDSFSIEFHGENYPSLISINFLKETMPGEFLQISRKKSSDNCYLFEGLNKSANTLAFRGSIMF